MPDVSMDTLVHCAAMLKADLESTERELRKVQREIRKRKRKHLKCDNAVNNDLKSVII